MKAIAKQQFLHARWALVLAPLLPLVLVVWASKPSVDVVAQSIDLSGKWVLHTATNDKVVSFPSVGQDLPYGEQVYLSKNFAIDALWEGPSELLIGSTSSGIFDVYVNDVKIGSEELKPGKKSAFHCFFSGTFSTSLLRVGTNTVSLRGTWFTDWRGLNGPQLRLGPAKFLGRFARSFDSVWSLVVIGSGVAFLLGFVLLSTIAVLNPLKTSRGAVRFGIAMCGCFGLCIFFDQNPGYMFGPELIERLSTASAFLGGTCLTWLVHKVFFPRLRWATRAITMLCAVSVICYAIPVSNVSVAIGFFVGMISVLTACIAIPVRTLGAGIRRRSVASVALSFGCATTALLLCGQLVSEISPNFSVFSFPVPDTSFPSVFLLGINALAIVLQEFLNIVRTNYQLTRTLRTTNTSLETALQKARESSRLKDQLLASVSHELRTPLNSIINVPVFMLESLISVSYAACSACEARFELEPGERYDKSNGCPDCGAFKLELHEQFEFRDYSEPKQHLNLVQKSGERLLRVVNDLLDQSRLQGDPEQRVLQPVSVRNVYASVAEQFAVTARAAGIVLQVSLPNEAIHVAATEDLLFRMMSNLVDNAIKFGSDGGHVYVTAKPQAGLCELSVTDSGPGIAEEHRERIFEAFFQLDGTRTRSHGGTGLGLSIVKSLAGELGGDIVVDSAEGQGAVFTVRLRLSDVAGLRHRPEDGPNWHNTSQCNPAPG